MHRVVAAPSLFAAFVMIVIVVVKPVPVPRSKPVIAGELPPRAVRVTVKTMDGTPIPGARVELVRGPVSDVPPRLSRPSIDGPRSEHSVVADESGSATAGDVSAGRWFVVASAPGFARHVLVGMTRDEGDEAVETEVTLEKGSPFSGTILARDGAPAAGVAVVLQPVSHWPSDAACLRTTTDSRGAYRFDAVEAGCHELSYEVRPGFLTEETRVMVPPLDGLDLRTVGGATIEGVVRNAETGAALPNARVLAVLYEPARSSAAVDGTTLLDAGTTDHLGRFALRTWRRETELSWLVVDAPGYVPTPVEESGIGPPGKVADGQRFAFDVRLRREATYRGVLAGPDGPLAGFTISMRPEESGEEDDVPEDRRWRATTAADGSFVIERLPAGAARVSIWETASHWFDFQERTVDVVRDDKEVHAIRLDVQRLRATGCVLNDKDEPVADVSVSQRLGPYRAESRTDAEGRFAIEAISTSGGRPMFVELRKGRIRMNALLHTGDEDGSPVFPAFPSRPRCAAGSSASTGRPSRANECI